VAQKKNKKVKNIFAQVLPTEPKIEMTGNKEIIVDGCNGIAEYDENIIKISTNTITIGIEGQGLIITSYDNKVIIVNGQIADLSFTS
jgi:sporulation protein YqfC